MSDQIEHWDKLSVHELDASVIDPRDVRGAKNAYITTIRNSALLESLRSVALGDGEPILDFGCGTGGISRALYDAGFTTIGVDISTGLLQRTKERRIGEKSLFLRYDGVHLPLRDESIGATVTYVVLNHILSDEALFMSLAEIHRVLRRGGCLVAIEQVRSRRTVDERVWQCRRSIGEFADLFKRAGFSLESFPTILRYGRFPMTYMIRAGWIPQSAYGAVSRVERWAGRTAGVVAWDYCDVRFVLRKL